MFQGVHTNFLWYQTLDVVRVEQILFLEALQNFPPVLYVKLEIAATPSWAS